MWGAALTFDIALWAFNKYVLDDQPTPLKPQPQHYQIANTQGGIPIPLVYGLARVDTPALVWYGNVSHSNPDDTNGVIYYGADLLFVLGVPAYNQPVRLGRMWWGDKVFDSYTGAGAVAIGGVGFSGDLASFEAICDLGGSDQGGQVVPIIQFYAGGPNQDVSAPGTLFYECLTRAGDDPTLSPGYRNQICVCVKGSNVNIGGLGTNPQLPQFAFEVMSP